MRSLITASIVAGGLVVLGAASVFALPAATDGAAKRAAAEQSPIVQVHDCHRGVEEGRRGWHYHRGRDCDRISVPPPRTYRRGPRCYTDCKYVGPIKVCKERCD